LENVHVVYIGVDVTECKPLTDARERRRVRKKYGVGGTGPMLVYPARMSPEKNPGRFFAVARRVVAQRPDVVIVAVGGGVLLSQLNANMTNAELDGRIVTTGALDHTEALSLIAAADVMMLTSDYEGISLATFEAMAAGVVSFSTDVGFQRELVTSDTGRLIPLDDQTDYVYAIALLEMLGRHS
jgi:glycosyltransferase involved in cell wall biosynthesis